MPSKYQRECVRSTTIWALIVLGIGLAVFFIADRDVASAPGSVAETVTRNSDSVDDGSTAPGLAPSDETMRERGVQNSITDASFEPQLRSSQRRVSVVEGSRAERMVSGSAPSRMPERAPVTVAAVRPPRPEPRSADHPLLAADGAHRAVLAPLSLADLERLELAAKAPGPLEVGPVRALAMTPEAIELPVADEEPRLRAFAVRATGAASMRLHFSAFDVGAGEVLVYATTSDGPAVLGPFTARGPGGRGEFWTGPIPGDEAVIEISGSSEAVVEVDRTLHAHLDAGAREDAVKAGDGLLTCHEDVMCHSVDQIARDAVGRLSFMEDGVGYVCSGTLIADEDDETVVPYLLTARHCIGTQTVADTLNVTWLYQSSSCGAAEPNWTNSPMSPNGGDLVVTNSDNDMTFIRLRDPIPAGVGMAGWTTNTGVSGAHGIHHPNGSFKRYSDANAVGFCPNCICKDPTDYDFYDQEVGTVQGGSSGSAVFDGQGRVAGQLWGRCSKGFSNPDDMTCGDTDDFWAVYGEFQTSYSKVRRWLEIGGTVRVADWSGPGGYGTPNDPFGTLDLGIDFAWEGSRVKIDAGNYAAPSTLDKPLTFVADGGVVTLNR